MEILLDTIDQFWTGFQQGELPDLGTWNYILVAVFMMFQGRISAIFSGIAAATGHISLLPIIIVALSARLIVDLFWYNVGATGQIDRVGRRFNFYQRISDPLQDRIRNKPRQFILLAKLSNGLALPAVIAAGNSRVPYRQWLPVSFAAELLWTIPLLFLGYFATGALTQVEGGLSYLTLGMTVFFLLAFVAYGLKTWRGARRGNSL
jgi:membrane protein DedA with SNARE-associated domain